MPASAIEHAKDERRQARQDFDRAQSAILETVPEEGGIGVRDLLREVGDRTDLPVPVIQRALWTLVRKGTLRLSEEFEPERPPAETAGHHPAS